MAGLILLKEFKNWTTEEATFARTKLMEVAIKRFLTQLKRHHLIDYQELYPEMLTRYEKSESGLFADHSKDKAKRSNLRQEVAQQLHQVITIFSGHAKVENMDTYKNLVLIFNQQCEVISQAPVVAESNEKDDLEETVQVKKKTGGDVIQNPSDLDVTYDGHKGVGYQVQICETSASENEVQLITTNHPKNYWLTRYTGATEKKKRGTRNPRLEGRL